MSYIKKFWVIDNQSSISGKEISTMLPDGCLEIILVQGNGFQIKTTEAEFNCIEGVYLGGQLSGILNLKILPHTKLLLLKINPWISPLITNFPIGELTNNVIPFSEINKPLAQKFHAQLASFVPEKIVEAFNKEIEKGSKFNKEAQILFRSCNSLVNYSQDFGQTKSTLLSDLRISSRTLENKFRHHIGLSPKQYANMTRLRRIIEYMIYDAENPSLTSISLDYGFFDQAHFTRSFKSYVGVPPTKLEIENYFIPNSMESFRYYTI